jgi:hypothetical protein
MLKIIEKKVNEHPFKGIEDMGKFIDQLFHDLWKQNGRTTDTIRTAKYHRTSV